MMIHQNLPMSFVLESKKCFNSGHNTFSIKKIDQILILDVLWITDEFSSYTLCVT